MEELKYTIHFIEQFSGARDRLPAIPRAGDKCRRLMLKSGV